MTVPVHFQFENHRRGGEIVMTVFAALLFVLSAGAAGWAFFAGARLLSGHLGLAVGTWLVGLVVSLLAGGFWRYVAGQVRGGLKFSETIAIDDTDVHYFYSDIEGESAWAEPLTAYMGVQVLGFRRRQPVSSVAISTLVKKSRPRSTGTEGSGVANAAPYYWLTILVHPVPKRSVRLSWHGSADAALDAAADGTARDLAGRLRVPRLPDFLPDGGGHAA